MTDLCVYVEIKQTTFLSQQLHAHVISMLFLTEDKNILKDYQVNMMIRPQGH